MSIRRDSRLPALLLLLGAVAAGGTAVRWLPGRGVDVHLPSAADSRAAPSEATVRERFERAAWLLHGRRYAEARVALEQVVQLAPSMPEGRVNLGFALLGVREYAAAREAFEQAIDLRPMQVNAYFGLAEALEAMGDLEAALGAMRTYTHLSVPDDPFRIRAEAAIWEWSAALGRTGAE